MLMVGNEKISCKWHGGCLRTWRQISIIERNDSCIKRGLRMKIMFDDLTYEAQMKLLDEAGISSPVQMRWHVLPIAVVDLQTKIPVVDEDDLTDSIYEQDEDY